MQRIVSEVLSRSEVEGVGLTANFPGESLSISDTIH